MVTKCNLSALVFSIQILLSLLRNLAVALYWYFKMLTADPCQNQYCQIDRNYKHPHLIINSWDSGIYTGTGRYTENKECNLVFGLYCLSVPQIDHHLVQ